MKPHHGEKQSEKSSSIKLGKDSGRVKVFVRVRPPRPQDNSRKEPIAVNVQEISSQIHVSDPKHSWEKTFNFDHVFPKESTNPEVCSTISRPLVNAALNGFNGTLMAYGQTGSGKTHTLMAPDGITAGVIERCFKRITQDDRHDYKVTMSYLQIYQEKIYDLLNSTNKVELSLREHPVKGVYVENLSEFVVRSPAEVLSLLTVGKKRLVFAETKMNRNSSRSHSVCQLAIERTLNKSKAQTEGSSRPPSSQARDPKDGKAAGSDKNGEGLENDVENYVTEEGADAEDASLAKMVAFNDDVLIRGRIYLCDLAGSERLKKTQAEGERLSEAQHINSSLLELGNVIQALAEGKKTHVPFRNSTLTRLLQESLGGNCKTSLVVCVSPTMCDVSETKSALSFGSRAMKITNTAYINVEIDYQRLSEDLSKIVDMKEKDLEDLRQSYENRIERIKHEAETTVTHTMTEADRVVASVKSLYENQQSSLQSEIESLNSSLEEERASTETLKGEMASAKCKLQEDMFRARSTLLMDIISMQLFYAVKEVSFDDAPFLSENEIKLKDVKDGFIQSVAMATKSKILENAGVLLELFKGYLNLMNTKGEKMLENSESLRFLIGSEEVFEEGTMLCDTEDESLYLTNKTDDDKVVASTLCNETPCDSSNEVIPSNEETPRDNDEYSSLRDKLVSLKNSVDGEALDFLKRAFEFDVENDSHPTSTRDGIYKRIQEFMDQRTPVLEAQKNSELLCQADALALLDHCHSHVIVDKALQSALLVLENNTITRRCHDIQKQKNVLEDENEALRKQIQILKNEAEKLSGKLDETSTKLSDVKKSKEQLEDGLCSVFQLYNMSNSERNEEKEEAQKDISLSPEKLQAQFSTLIESNEKLQEELVVKEEEKENLQCELTSVKQELQREKEKHSPALQDVKSTQTESTEHEESTNPSHDEHSVKFQDAELLHGILSALHDDYSSSLEKAASAAQTNDYADVSSLRTVINKRLGGEWSVLVLENAKMKSELDKIRERINEEKRSFVNELTTLQVNGSNEKALQGEDGVLTDENTLEGDEVSDHGSDEPVLKIKIYDQNKVIAKLEMDKIEIVKGLQRYKADSNKSDDQNDKIECFSETRNEDLPLTKDDLGTIVKEKLQELSTVQKEKKSLENELDLLRDKYNSLERSYEESNESRKSLEEKLENFVQGERNLCSEIVQLKERCSKLDDHLVRSTTDNNKLKEELKQLECKFYEAVQERETIKEQKIALEERLRQEQVDNERGLALEREQKNICEKNCQEKTQEFEDERRLLNIKENCLSKVEKELAETKESYKKLQECVNEHEKEKDNLMKEINSLRCLQGLPTIKRTPNNREEVNSNQGVSQSNGGSINREKRVHSRKNNKLNSELTLAKEQLVRLKAELTLSNMQTRNLGTQLSSLREDSTKLEAELSTVRLSSKDSRYRHSFTYYDETVRLELELGEAKERIIDLQEKLLIIYKEKFVLEERVMSLEDQAKKEKQDVVLSPLEGSRNDKNAAEALERNTEKPCATQTPFDLHQEQGMTLEQIKVFENKIDLLEAEKGQLKRDLENTHANKNRLEGIEYWVQQLVTLEDEQLRLKSKLKMWAQNGGDEQHLSQINQDYSFSPIKVDSSNVIENGYLNDLKDLSAENVTLQEEANTLKETIAELQSDLAALKLKAAMKEGSQESALDKKAVATLLVSVKQERAELQKALDGVLIERDDLEEELTEIKMKYTRLQREFAMTSMIKDDLELEILSLRKVNLSRGLSDLTQSSEECKSEKSDSSIDDLRFLGDDGAEVSSQERNAFDFAQNTVVPRDGRTIANAANNHQSKSSRSMDSSSKAKTNCSKKSLLPRPNNLHGLKPTTKTVFGRRTLPSQSSGEKLRSTSSDRFDTDDNQSTTDTEQQYTAICYDLIRIDDVNDDAMHADADCSGLVRLTPKGEREKPEGMEQDERTHDKTENGNKDDNCDIILDDSDNGGEPWTSFPGIAGSESLVVQSAEVLVKTAWSLKNIFRRQKSPPIPNKKHNALKEL